ncbi:hypothetical protein CLI72_06070 [Porphyromonas gingivalis]|jgi:hypothetical protein|nr:hypothetical protein CLI72_06070 [Porphyromonas gingivalis]
MKGLKNSVLVLVDIALGLFVFGASMFCCWALMSAINSLTYKLFTYPIFPFFLADFDMDIRYHPSDNGLFDKFAVITQYLEGMNSIYRCAVIASVLVSLTTTAYFLWSRSKNRSKE